VSARLVYLIKHASPSIEPNVRAERWRLSERGIEEARGLAEAAERWEVQSLYASSEPKASATALIIGERVGLTPSVVEGLEEIRINWIGNADEYSEFIRDVLEHPERSLRGTETAAAAARRFGAAMTIVTAGALPAAVVAHGRVLSAYLADLLALEDPFGFWRAMPMASWCCLDVDARKLRGEFTAAP